MTGVDPRRLLVAEPSPLMRGWLLATLRCVAPAAEMVGVANGLDLLYQLAECGRFDLVVTPAALRDLGGDQVLAMARTAGLGTPFVLISPADHTRLRALVARTSPAALVEDPLDAAAIAAAGRGLLARTRADAGAPCWARAFAAARVLRDDAGEVDPAVLE